MKQSKLELAESRSESKAKPKKNVNNVAVNSLNITKEFDFELIDGKCKLCSTSSKINEYILH